MKITLISILLVFFSLASCRPQSEEKLNVLFVFVDDLRPELGAYGATQIKSPNIDKLAANSLQFNRAYCNIPVCGASRASLLTGILPTKTRFVQYDSKASEDAPNIKTLPQLFKENGYNTYSVGKVFHDRTDTETKSWTTPNFMGTSGKESFLKALDPSTYKVLSKRGRGRIYEFPDVPDSAYPDGEFARKTKAHIKNASKTNEPFFIACGFIRPHLPFYAPKKYWDLYNRDSIELAENRFRPKDAPKALRGSGERYSYYLDSLKSKSDDFHKMMKHGYFASVSYIDSLIGDVLEQLEASGFAENTIVVLWGDHGWNLGEHEFWGKHNTMHHSMRVPLIIKLPKNYKGLKTNAIVESVDIYPTLCDLVGLEKPEHLQGESFKKLFNNPKKSFRDYAYSRFLSADAIITKTHTYTSYTGKNEGEMLYDLENDADENINIASKPKNKDVVILMKQYLDEAKIRAKL